MASEHIKVNEAIAKAVAETTKAAIQAIAVATIEKPQGLIGPRIGGPTMIQPNFNWEAENKYSKLKTFM